jgi:Tfp pilus assembly protein PilV
MSNNLKINNMSGAGSQSAFTLVEVVTALFIVMVGIISGYGLVNQTLATANSISMRLTAAYLGKEGIEIVKSIRDNNYLRIHYDFTGSVNWLNGLASGGAPVSIDCSGGCVAEYDSTGLSSTGIGQPLKYSGFYGYSSGDDTIYKRAITTVPNGDVLNVIVVVSWMDRGKSLSTTVQENLYNWWQ